MPAALLVRRQQITPALYAELQASSTMTSDNRA
jgi:hypothetical protein